MTITIQLGLDPETMQLLRGILTEIKKQGAQMTKEMQDLTDQVAATKTVVESAVVLLGGLAAQIEANKQDPVALQALADTLKTEDKSLADAVATFNPPAPVVP